MTYTAILFVKLSLNKDGIYQWISRGVVMALATFHDFCAFFYSFIYLFIYMFIYFSMKIRHWFEGVYETRTCIDQIINIQTDDQTWINYLPMQGLN